MRHGDIHNQMNARLEANRGTLAVAWPNVPFDTRAVDAFAAPTYLPGESFKDRLTGLERIPFVYQVDIYSGTDKGLSESQGHVDVVVEAFERGTEVYRSNGESIRVDAADQINSGQQGDWYRVTVQVRGTAIRRY